MQDLLNSSATEMANAIRRRETSAQELLDEHLSRIGTVNPKLNAIVTLDEEGARTAAVAADAQTAQGISLGPFHGVPFTVKDVIATRGVRTTAGSLTLADHVPGASASAIDRLQRGGGILVGKTNCPEFALDIDTDNRLFGRTANPFNSDLTPGGSSGGESAAVAGALSPLGIGTDYGGSIRWPAHCTGVTSLRPTGGIVPGSGQLPYTPMPGVDCDQLSHVPPPNSMSLQAQLQRIAPIARRVVDLWSAVTVMAGPDGLDGSVAPVVLGDPDAVDVRALRCGWFDSDGNTPVDSEVAVVVEDAANALADFGLHVERRLPSGLAEAEPLFQRFRAADGLFDHAALARGRETLLTDNMGAWLAAGIEVSVRQYREIAAQRDLLRARVLRDLDSFPVLLLPVGGLPAFRHDARELEVEGVAIPRLAVVASCRAISLLNLPAAAVPCGTSSQGMPIGVQVVGRPFHDHEVVAVAATLEKIFGQWRPLESRPLEKRIGAQ